MTKETSQEGILLAMVSIIAIVALVVLSVDILNEYTPNYKLCILWLGFVALFILLFLCLRKYTSLKDGPLKRYKG